MNHSACHHSLAASMSLGLVSASLAQSDVDSTARIRALEDRLESIESRHDAEIAAIREEQGQSWLTEERATEIRSTVADVLADADSRVTLQGTTATSGYDKGFFLSSADGNFRLNIKGQLDMRYSYAGLGGDDSGHASGFEMRRAKLTFSGHVFDPSWQYEVKASFNRNGGAGSLDDVFIQKDFGDGWMVRGGQWKDRFLFEEMTSSSKQQLVERSVTNQYFTTKYVQGIAVDWTGQSLRAYGSFNDGGNSANTQLIGASNGSVAAVNTAELAFTGRVDWLVSGTWKQLGEFMSWRGNTTTAAAGAAIHWEKDRTVASGVVLDQLLTWTVDANLRWGGASASGAFLWNESEAQDGATSQAMGFVAQGGYFLTDDVEAVVRGEYLDVENPTGSFGGANIGKDYTGQHYWAATVGLNYYLRQNGIKFQLDVSYLDGGLLFSRGIYNESISGTDFLNTTPGGEEVVIRLQTQLLF